MKFARFRSCGRVPTSTFFSCAMRLGRFPLYFSTIEIFVCMSMSLESFADDLSSARGDSGLATPSSRSLMYRLRNLMMYLSVIASSISSVQLASRHISSSCPSRCPSNPPTKPNLMSLMPKFSTLDATSNSDALLRQSTASCCPFSPKYPFGSWLPGAYDFSVKLVWGSGSSGSPATSEAFERQ